MANIGNLGLNQTAVYWEYDGRDGYGGFTYLSPIEIDCKWEDEKRIIHRDDGSEVVSIAQVKVDRDLKRNSQLYLGTLDDLTNTQESDPDEVQEAYPIYRTQKIANLKGNTYDRWVFLNG